MTAPRAPQTRPLIGSEPLSVLDGLTAPLLLRARLPLHSVRRPSRGLYKGTAQVITGPSAQGKKERLQVWATGQLQEAMEHCFAPPGSQGDAVDWDGLPFPA